MLQELGNQHQQELKSSSQGSPSWTWMWATVLLGLSFVWAVAFNIIVRVMRHEPVSDLGSVVGFVIISLPLVPVALEVLYYHLVSRWNAISFRRRTIYVLGVIALTGVLASGVYIWIGAYAVGFAIPVNIMSLIVSIALFPRSTNIRWNYWHYALLLILFAVLLSVTGCAGTPKISF